MADYGAACVAGPTGVPGESVRCNLRSIDVLVADSACANSDVARTEDGLHHVVRLRPQVHGRRDENGDHHAVQRHACPAARTR